MIPFSQLLQKQFYIGTTCLDEFVNTSVKEWDTKQVFAKKRRQVSVGCSGTQKEIVTLGWPHRLLAMKWIEVLVESDGR